MRRVPKFVAAVLIAASLAAPVSAATHCLLMGKANPHCMPGCTMMGAHSQSAMQANNAPSSEGSCCQLSSMPSRTKETAATPRSEISAPIIQLVYLAMTPASPSTQEHSTAETPPSPGSSSHQSLFCTFLV